MISAVPRLAILLEVTPNFSQSYGINKMISSTTKEQIREPKKSTISFRVITELELKTNNC